SALTSLGGTDCQPSGNENSIGTGNSATGAAPGDCGVVGEAVDCSSLPASVGVDGVPEVVVSQPATTARAHPTMRAITLRVHDILRIFPSSTTAGGPALSARTPWTPRHPRSDRRKRLGPRPRENRAPTRTVCQGRGTACLL